MVEIDIFRNGGLIISFLLFSLNHQTDEDEETRAYRLEIEKQKAQREKILRDKEMRRRKAAEELKKEDGPKPAEVRVVISISFTISLISKHVVLTCKLL